MGIFWSSVGIPSISARMIRRSLVSGLTVVPQLLAVFAMLFGTVSTRYAEASLTGAWSLCGIGSGKIPSVPLDCPDCAVCPVCSPTGLPVTGAVIVCPSELFVLRPLATVAPVAWSVGVAAAQPRGPPSARQA